MFLILTSSVLSIQTTDATVPFSDIRILEVAVCVTDKNFTPLDRGLKVLVHWEKKVNGAVRWADRDDVLRSMPDV